MGTVSHILKKNNQKSFLRFFNNCEPERLFGLFIVRYSSKEGLIIIN